MIRELAKQKRQPFTPHPITQEVGGQYHVDVFFEDGGCYASRLNGDVVVYRSFDDNRIVGCQLWIVRDDIIPQVVVTP